MSGVLVVGSANMDLSIKGARLPAPGETVLGETFQQAHGGKGANQAVAAARAARPEGITSFIAAVGTDAFGDEAMAHFAIEGLNSKYVIRVPERPTGVALILLDAAGRNMISVHSGANAALTPAHIDAVPDEFFQRHRVMVAQLETPPATVRAALRRAKRLGLTTIVNPAPALEGFPSPEDCELIDVIVPNETEIELATGIKLTEPENEVAAASTLMERGCGAVALTLGERGCLTATPLSPNRTFYTRIPAFRASAVDTVAAGDAFIGALARRLADSTQGAPMREVLPDAARWASAAAAISVTRRGAQPSLPRRDEIEEYCKSGESV